MSTNYQVTVLFRSFAKNDQLIKEFESSCKKINLDRGGRSLISDYLRTFLKDASKLTFGLAAIEGLEQNS